LICNFLKLNVTNRVNTNSGNNQKTNRIYEAVCNNARGLCALLQG